MLLDLSLPSVPPAARPVSGVTEHATKPGWHRVPSRCHRPRSVPAIHPRAASPGDSRSAAAGCSQPRLCLKLTGFHLPQTPLLGEKALFPAAKETAPLGVGAGDGEQVLSFSALQHWQRFALCVENSTWDLLVLGDAKITAFPGPHPESPQPHRHLGCCAGLRRCRQRHFPCPKPQAAPAC